MENIMILYALYVQYISDKEEQCLHYDDWKALQRVKEIMANDFPRKALGEDGTCTDWHDM